MQLRPRKANLKYLGKDILTNNRLKYIYRPESI